MQERAPSASATLEPFTRHHFDRDGIRMHYVDEGSGDPVVMVHGNPSWSFYYRELIRALRTTHRAIAPDHVGCGLSDKPGDDRYEYRLASRIDDLGRLLDHLSVRSRVTLVVHDWGGAIGLGWAVAHPERVERLVLLNTAAFPLPEGKPLPWSLRIVRDLRAVGWLVLGANAFARITTRVACRSLPRNVRAAYLAPYDSWQHRLAILRFVQDIPLGPDDPSWPLLMKIHEGLSALRDIPALVCWGGRDFIFDDAFLSQWRRELPGAEVHVFADAGHYVMEDAASEVIACIGDFLARHPLPAAGP